PREDEPTDQDLPEEEEQEKERPRRTRKRRRSGAWRWGRVGMLILIVAAGLGLLNTLSNAGLSGLMADFAFRAPGGLKKLLAAGLLFHAVAGLLHAGGFGLCLFAPRESESRPFSIAALSSVLLSGVLSGYLLILTYQTMAPLGMDSPPDPSN